MIDISDLISNYRDFLNASWGATEKHSRLTRDENFIGNWLQANWEMFLEGELSRRAGSAVVLDHYGQGAEDLVYGLPRGLECFDRVSLPTARPNYTVVCQSESSKVVDVVSGGAIDLSENYTLSEFCSVTEEGRVVRGPPFDVAVILGPEHEVLVAWDRVAYFATPVDRLKNE